MFQHMKNLEFVLCTDFGTEIFYDISLIPQGYTRKFYRTLNRLSIEVEKYKVYCLRTLITAY